MPLPSDPDATAVPRTPRVRSPRRTPVALRPAWLVLTLLLLVWLPAACRGRATVPPLSPDDPAATAQRLEAYLKDHPEDDDAWRDLAHVRWLHLGDLEAARPVLDRLADAGDPASRMSRLIIALSHDEPQRVQALAFAAIRDAAAAADDDPKRRLLLAEAEHAARILGDVHGDRAGDDERFVALMDSIALDRLPLPVTRPLMSLRAAIARRHHEDYRPFYEAQGCVQAWQAGPVEGSRGAVELGRMAPEPGPVEVDPDAAVVPLACVVRVWNPEPSPGVRRMVTHLRATEAPVLLDLGADEASRFYVDGTLVHATDAIDRYVPDRMTLQLSLAPGWHRLEVHTTIPAERAWVMVRALHEGGTVVAVQAEAPGSLAQAWTGRAKRVRAPWPEPLPGGGIEGPIYAPLRAYLAVEDALAEGDSDLAERRAPALARAERFAEGQWLQARVERADPSRGRAVSVSREVGALERALDIDPTLDAARLRLLDLQRDRGDDAEVERTLRTLPPGQLDGVDGELLRFHVLLAQGNEYLAEQALERAAARSPGSCKVLLAQRTLARERADVRREDEIAQALSVCAGSLGLRARLAEARGRWDDARALWEEELDRIPDDLQAHESLARVDALRGDRSSARAHLGASLRYNPFRVGSHLALADLAATEGDLAGARAELTEALRKIPQSNSLWRSAHDLGLVDDLMQWRIDGAAVLADYRAVGARYEGVGEVLVLDRSVARVYENGGQRQIVHIMAELLSKEALDDYGELDIPDGAELLTLRTIKPDGRRLEPELVPGKDGVSLRHLEIGDVVEYEFIVERGPAGAVPGYVDVSTFRFQSADVPYHRSELLVVHPPEVPIRHDPRNAPPVDEVRTVEVAGKTLTEHHFRADEVPRLGVEPGARPWLEELPSVHVYTPLDLPLYLDGLAAQVRDSQRRNPELRALVRRLTRGATDDRERLETLWAWVVTNVEDAGDLSTPASATLAARTGSRLMLLRAMLREAGLSAELWLARDGYGPQPVPGGHPLVESYEAAMLAVYLPDATAGAKAGTKPGTKPGTETGTKPGTGETPPLMVLTASKVMPLGYLAPGYRSTDGLRIQLEPHEGASGPVQLPGAPPGLEDRRRFDLDFTVRAGGSAEVHGTITLQGMESILWRQALKQIDRDRIEEVFLQAELGWLPGATLQSLEIEAEDQLSQPLVLRFAARTGQVGVMQDGDLVLRLTPMPLNPGAPYTALPQRTTGLVVPYAPQLEVELRYAIEGGTVATVPRPIAFESPYGAFERTVVEGKPGGKSLTLRVRSSLTTGVVEPQDYGDLAAYTREVEQAVQDVLRVR